MADRVRVGLRAVVAVAIGAAAFSGAVTGCGRFGRSAEKQKAVEETAHARSALGEDLVDDTNLALHKAASQSNTSAGGLASYAVDGVTDGNYALALGTIAGDGNNLIDRPWWQVDLGEMDWISSITIWGRTDCCSFRNQDFYVFVSDVPFTPADDDLAATRAMPGIWEHYVADQLQPNVVIPVNRSGQYVRIQMNHRDTFYLAEVQASGRKMINHSQGAVAGPPADGQKTVRQSGQHYAFTGPEKAVDGNTTGDGNPPSYMEPDPLLTSPTPWWEIDLGAVQWISEVKLWNIENSANW